ncbi:MAG: MmgE/PrpD family protein, partial [Planctomycetota bacterium]
MMSKGNRDWDYCTRTVARFCASHSYEKLPPPAVKLAKTIVMDVVGAMLLGSTGQYPGMRILGEYVHDLGGKPECTLVGRSFKANCEGAALFNGTLGYAADFEGGVVVRTHAGGVLVPTAITVAERQQASGKTLIAALVLGYEVIARVAEANRPETSYPHSFHPSAVFGHFGAGAIAGHTLGLNEEQFVRALGLAGINATGLINWVDDPTEHSRPYVCGVASSNGIRSALLAQRGFGAPLAVLDPTKFNIYDAFSGSVHPERLLEGLGEHYWITSMAGFKRHPCCRDIHTGLDALLEIMERAKVTGDDIATITHRVKADRAPIIDDNELKSHNAQYIMAVAAVNGRIATDDFLHDRRSNPKIAEMYRNVTLVGDPELDKIEPDRPAIVEVVTKDGRRFLEKADWPRGNPHNPFTEDEMREKFLNCATAAFPRERAE